MEGARLVRPGSLMLTRDFKPDHPYPGTFPLATSQTEIEASLCKYSQMYKNFPAPILITEWSIRTGISDLAFEQSFYEKQALVWAKYANGGVFWNFKTLNGTGVNANNIQYSFLVSVPKA